jgi:hypothetical protein
VQLAPVLHEVDLMLRGMAATDAASATELASVREKLDEFVQWTKDGLKQLDDLAKP